MDQAAHPARAVRFGAFEVDMRSGELRKQGVKLKLQEQPFQILAMLLEHPGEVVTREELRKRLWPEDTFVDFDHSLSTAINKIREALSDSAEGPRFVETLPRRGYRFIAPVEAVAPVSPPATSVAAVYDRRSQDAPVAPVSPPAPETRGPQPSPIPTTGVSPLITTGGYTRRAVTAMAQGIFEEHRARLRWQRGTTAGLAIAGLLLLVGGAIGYRHFRKPPAPPMRVVPFTTFPGLVGEPSFSPDGNPITFSWKGENDQNWHIYAKVIGEESVLELTSGPADDYAPAWSPDGRYIAFCRRTGQQYGIYVVPALGGPERRIRSINPASGLPVGNPAWSPDGKYLAYAGARPGQQSASIFLLAVDNPDDTRALTFPDRPHVADWLPRFSPDGRSVAFLRFLSRGSATDVYVVRVAGGEPKRLTFDNVNINGLDWTPDGAYLVFSSDRLGEGRLWKVRASGGDPEPLSVGQGGAFGPSLSRDGHRLAYIRALGVANIWRYEVPRVPGRSVTATKLVASTQDDLSQQFLPDGRRIAFASYRSGSYEIWVCDSDGTPPLQLTFFGGPMTGSPHWSSDGQQIAFDSEPEGHGDIYVVSADGGRPRRLTTETSNDNVPSWSRDGKRIYFASDRTGTWQVWKMPPEGGRAVQVTKQGGFAPIESTDGKTLYYAKGQNVPGLWRVPVQGGAETPVLEQLGAGLWGYWSLTAEGIYFYDTGTKAIEFFSFATQKVTQIFKPEKEALRFNPGFAVSPDGRWILYAQLDQVTRDIMLVENFRW